MLTILGPTHMDEIISLVVSDEISMHFTARVARSSDRRAFRLLLYTARFKKARYSRSLTWRNPKHKYPREIGSGKAEETHSSEQPIHEAPFPNCTR